MKKLPPGSIWVPADGYMKRTIIALHGQGGDATDFEGLDEELGLEGTQYLYLRAPIPYYTGYTWYRSPKQLGDGLQRVQEGIVALGIPLHSLFLLGFSQGGALAMELTMQQEEIPKGVIAISSRVEDLPRLLAQAKPVHRDKGRFLFTHGGKDEMLSPQITRQQVSQLKETGFHVDYQEFDKGHTFDFTQELPYIQRWITMFS